MSRARTRATNRIPDLINVSELPAAADDRHGARPLGGDLIIGRGNQSAMGTLVERTTGYAMLLHGPRGYTPELGPDA